MNIYTYTYTHNKGDIDTDILSRCVAGESMESIAASYGLKLEELQKLSNEALDIYKRERLRK